jgi:hypothetical protein
MKDAFEKSTTFTVYYVRSVVVIDARALVTIVGENTVVDDQKVAPQNVRSMFPAVVGFSPDANLVLQSLIEATSFFLIANEKIRNKSSNFHTAFDTEM